MPQETAPGAPEAERDQHGRERQHLPDFHSHIKTDDVGHQPVLRQIELLQLGRQAKAVEPAAGKLPMAAPASPAEQSRQFKNADSKAERKTDAFYDINAIPKICRGC